MNTSAPPGSPVLRLPRANVLGVGVHGIDMARAIDAIDFAIATGTKAYVCVTGVHGVMEAQVDTAFRACINDAFLVVPDGMPTVWVGRLQGLCNMRRVFGPDLMLQVCRWSLAKGYTHFLYGGDVGVAQQLQHNLTQMFPGLRIAGTYSPPFGSLSATELDAVRETFAQLKPDITWIGLSTPKQERFMSQHLAALDTTVMIGVGAAFDYHTGRIRDCPQWMKPLGLQWVHRLWQEPTRLWRRYLYNNPRFLLRIALQLAGIQRYELRPPGTCDLDNIENASRT